MDKYLYKTIQKVKPFDLMIHLGDYGGTEEYIQSLVDCPEKWSPATMIF